MNFFNMFKRAFWRKKKDDTTDGVIASLTYIVDKDNTIWVDCEWSSGEGDHLRFAELLHGVTSGTLQEDTLKFLEEECAKNDRSLVYLDILRHLAQWEEERTKDILSTFQKLDPPLEEKDDLVVKPTEVARNIQEAYE
jgi:hypothetical protein